MTARRSHYELAFEHYLNRRGTPYVAVEDVRHYIRERIGTKAFDYIVYPPGKPASLVDVKGRKVPRIPASGDCREKNWVTKADVDGMVTWQRVFGPEYLGMFAFAYWLAGGRSLPSTPLDPAGQTFSFAGRIYSFWLMPVSEYARHQKQLSRSWRTVSIPREVFHRSSQRLDCVWPAAPC